MNRKKFNIRWQCSGLRAEGSSSRRNPRRQSEPKGRLLLSPGNADEAWEAALACAKGHLSAVLRGERKSNRLRERAREMGIKLPKAPRKEKVA